jgi:anti-sigma regulatory factor (Ser/Thr protein kinase)
LNPKRRTLRETRCAPMDVRSVAMIVRESASVARANGVRMSAIGRPVAQDHAYAKRYFPARTESVGGAREFVAHLYSTFGIAPPDEAILVLSELATNAVQHARTSFDVVFELVGCSVRISVTDGSNELPVVREPDSAAFGGRGIRIVSALSDWDVRQVDGYPGKTIRFTPRMGPTDG